MFDESTFLQSTITGALDTTRPIIPVGSYTGAIKEIKGRQNAGTKPTNQGKIYTSLDLSVELQLTPEAQAEMNLDQPNITRRYSIMIDLNESGNGLDMGKGKNVSLGQLRDALGQNDPSKPWSPSMLVGQAAKWTVKHGVYNGSPVDEISGVGKLD